MAEPRRPDELLLDELLNQLDRTRQLLTGSPGDAAERTLDRLARDDQFDTLIAVELATLRPLAAPSRFSEAHRLVMRALEVLDRDGFRNPRVGRLGPLAPLARAAAEFVAKFIVRSYTKDIVDTLRTLYVRRESQCEPRSPERAMLSRARIEVERMATGFSGGGIGAPVLLAAGAAVPAAASLSQQAGAIGFDERWLLPAGVVLLVLFFSLAWALLRGAAVARRRSQLIMQRPLTALWETIGHAGNPPEDQSVGLATIAILLTALVWFALPAVIALGFVVF